MESFVHEDLGVPKHRIKTLFDKEATRKRILKALDDLQENEGIKRDDPIFIFFAGHGCAIKSEQLQGWGAGDRKEIQAICPQDVKVWGTPNRAESPIPDFILASLINKLSRKKGNNIVGQNLYIPAFHDLTRYWRRLLFLTVVMQLLVPVKMWKGGYVVSRSTGNFRQI